MVTLSELGFLEGDIFETIISTYDSHGKPNAAPMGIIMINKKQVKINMFNTSLTLRNLKTKKAAVINLYCNAELFYRTTFKQTNPQNTLPKNWFKKAKTVDAPS
jgi:hypothetical protein